MSKKTEFHFEHIEFVLCNGHQIRSLDRKLDVIMKTLGNNSDRERSTHIFLLKEEGEK